MFLRIPKRFRVAAATVAVAAYALPVGIGILADTGHVAQHVRSEIRKHERVAAVLRLDDSVKASASGGFVHTHGGSTHSHDGATAALLRAAQHTDDGSQQDQAPSLELAGHLPGMLAETRFPAAPEVAIDIAPASVGLLFLDAPLIPPPRA